MGIHQFYYVWYKRQRSGRSTQRPRNVSSLMIDMNGILHGTASKVYGVKDLTPPNKYAKKEDIDRYVEAEAVEASLRTRANYAHSQGPIPFQTLLNELETEHFNAIAAKLVTILAETNPRELLIISIDGPAPWAKLKQQRSRRFKGAKKRELTTLRFHGQPIYDLSGNIVNYELTSNTKGSSSTVNAPYEWPLFDSSVITPGTDFMFRLDTYLRKWLGENVGILPHKVEYYCQIGRAHV